MDNIIDNELQNAYLRLTPEERFDKMLSMCKTVREIITSGLPADNGETDNRKLIFEIYYKSDFSIVDFERINDMIFNQTPERR